MDSSKNVKYETDTISRPNDKGDLYSSSQRSESHYSNRHIGRQIGTSFVAACIACGNKGRGLILLFSLLKLADPFAWYEKADHRK